MNKRPPLRRSAPVEAENDGVIEGRNAVIEALRAGTAIDKIYIMKGETDSALGHIASAAREKGIVVVDADRRKLDGMSRTHSHQGVIALAAVREYASVDDILNAAREKGENPLIVVCDELSDPHNLGAVIRTADAARRRGPRGHHPQAPLRRPHRRGGQDLCRSGGPRARGPGAQPARPAQGAEGGGGLGVRHRRRRHHPPLSGRSEGARRHRHRQRGDRHGAAGGGELRLYRLYSHVREDQLPERFGGGRRSAV